ncbi:uncharacterized protein LOC141653824 isoform X2 [Silene latifolia]|uniref:uncharacterized protein LOC141653824 isoform X2 n=1 Tax=Silene latifolia TaxID=37657 RepID=UPI003D782745
MEEEQTLIDSKSSFSAKSEEISQIELNPLPKTMDLENPSPDSAKSDENVGGSITITPESVQVPAIDETLEFGEIEGNVRNENPVVGCCKSSDTVENDTQVNKNIEENREINQIETPVFSCSEKEECNTEKREEFENILCDEILDSSGKDVGKFRGPNCMEEEKDEEVECSRFYGRRVTQRRSDFVNEGFKWSEPEPCPVGAGLSNLGSTCFLNAIMQCFTHTVPLVEGILSMKHDASSHGKDEFCVLCAVRDQIEQSLKYSGKILSPYNLVDNLNYISSFFRRYQQEDAHEFLQCLLDKLDDNWSKHDSNVKKLSPSHDSLVKQIFGGRLVSQLHCCKCGHNSDSYEPVIDLSLEIDDVDDLESAFRSFTKVENLEDTSNCDNCKEKVQREKQLLLDRTPAIAALHLKRFKSDGEKIDRMVKYPLELELDSYTKDPKVDDENLKYELYGFVVHVGSSSTSGHYYSYIRTSPDAWYRFDDSKVSRVSEETALNQEAYILFYARKGTPWFSSLLEQWKTNLEEKSNTSPKSVLDRTDVTNSVTRVDPLSWVSLAEFDEDDSVAVQESTGASTCLRYGDDVVRENLKNESTRTGLETCSLSTGATTCLRYSADVMKEHVRVDTARTGCSENNLSFKSKYDHEIIRSPSPAPGSPDIYADADEKPDAEPTFKIPVGHLKVEEKATLSGKRKAKQDSERKEAAKYLKFSSMPIGRRQLLMAAISPDSSSKKKPKQSSMTHQEKHPKVGPKHPLRTLAASV